MVKLAGIGIPTRLFGKVPELGVTVYPDTICVHAGDAIVGAPLTGVVLYQISTVEGNVPVRGTKMESIVIELRARRLKVTPPEPLPPSVLALNWEEEAKPVVEADNVAVSPGVTVVSFPAKTVR
jgi:hypothetical protein